MARFEYQARTRRGELVRGDLEAPDRRAALVMVDELGYYPIRVEPAKAPKAIARGKGRARAAPEGRAGRIRRRDVLMFTEQMSNLLRSGMSLSQALETLKRQAVGRPIEPVLADLHSEIKQGTDFSDALAKHPRVFPSLYSSMVRAGEASGTLPEILQRLSSYFSQSQELREKIIGALAYPMVILAVGVGLIIFVMTYMVPRFQMLFRELGTSLPLPTRILIGMSDAMIRYGWLLIVAVLGIVFGLRAAGRTEKGRLWIDGVKLRLPIVGRILSEGMFTQFARTLSTLLANGVPVLDSLRIVERTLDNAVLRRELQLARDRVTDGTTIAQPLAAGKIFPPLLIDMLAVGEETGDLPAALEHIADMYDQELSRDVKLFTTLLEPLMIVIMAVIVGFVVFSILIAVFQMTSGLQI